MRKVRWHPLDPFEPLLNQTTGMFLYVKLVLVNLYAFNTRAELFDAIKADHFPKELRDA